MVLTRGVPTYSEEVMIHLRVPQSRKGMREGEDYAMQLACRNGSYHVNYTNLVDEVTCKPCLEARKS